MSTVTDAINHRLIELKKEGRSVVVFIDEAQALPDETLEAVRLFGNLETESSKLLQIVLFGQPELDERLARPEFRQLRQRIAFSYRLRPLTMNETDAYIASRPRRGLPGTGPLPEALRQENLAREPRHPEAHQHPLAQVPDARLRARIARGEGA